MKSAESKALSEKYKNSVLPAPEEMFVKFFKLQTHSFSLTEQNLPTKSSYLIDFSLY